MKTLRLLLVLIAIVFAAAPASQAQQVQSAVHYFGNASSGTLTFGFNTTAGDAIIVPVGYNNTPTVTVTDTQLNTFTTVTPANSSCTFPIAGGGVEHITFLIATNINGGPDTVTIHLSASQFFEAAAMEYINVKTATPVDVCAGGTGTGSTASSGSATTTVNGDYIVGYINNSADAAMTVGSGFTSRGVFNSTNSLIEDQTQATAGSIAATATGSSGTWNAEMIALEEADTSALVSIAVTPSTGSVFTPGFLGTTTQFTATGTYADTTTRNLTGAVTWSSSLTSKATIVAGGLATGVAVGSTTITATFGAISGTATLNVTANPRDIYGGLTSVPCSNSNTTFSIDSTTYPGHPVLCTPQGHAGFYRCPEVIDINLNESWTDEFGNTYQNYMTNKFGPNSIWFNQSLQQMTQYYGFNCSGAESNPNLFPITGQTYQVPYIYYTIVSAYSLINRFGTNTGYVKPTFVLLSPTWGGFKTSNEVADYRDPAWANQIPVSLANDGQGPLLASCSATCKGYVIGMQPDDSDNLHGFGAGPDFTTQPTSGNNDYRFGYIELFIAPTAWASSLSCFGCNYGGTIYSSPKVYQKDRFRALALAAHGGSISTWATAWSAGYTTDGSSGTCVGPSLTITCASTIGAETVGSGNGSTTTFSHTLANTTVSKFSLGIFVGGVLVGGDRGDGTIIGPNLVCTGSPCTPTSTVNYSTGAIVLNFVTAPVSGTNNITAQYIQNGWGIGTGFMDEDCRSGHSSYCGNGNSNTTVYLCTTPPSTGCLSAAVQADINAYSKDAAAYYASTMNAGIQTYAAASGFTGRILYLGATAYGTWGTPSDRYVLQGLAGNTDVYTFGGAGIALTQPELDFIHTYMGNVPVSQAVYNTNNAQSEFAWTGSPAAHVGTTVTATITMPAGTTANIFTTDQRIDTQCTHPDYQVTNALPSAVTGISGGTATVSWVVSVTPTETSDTCDVYFSDVNVGGYLTAAAKGTAYANLNFPSQAYTATGYKPFIFIQLWDFFDDQTKGQKLSWAFQTVKGNTVDGLENVTGSVPCQPPLQSFTCGGERNNGGNLITSYKSAHTALDNYILSLPAGAPPLPAPSSGSFAINWTAVPVPAQPPAPSLTSCAPTQSYVTAAGFSQDDLTFVNPLKLKCIGTNFNPAPTVTFDGKAATATFVSPTEVDITVPLTMVSLPGASSVKHSIVLTVPPPPPTTIPVIQ